MPDQASEHPSLIHSYSPESQNTAFKWRYRNLVLLVLVTMISVITTSLAHALPSSKQVETQLEQVEQNTLLTEDTKKTLTELLESTRGFLDQAEESRQESQRYSKATNTQPNLTKEIQTQIKRLERNPASIPANTLEELSFETIEQQILSEEANQNSLTSEVSDIEHKLTNIQDRPSAILRTLGELSSRQDKIESALATTPEPDSSDLESLSRYWLLQAENKALTEKQKALEQELLSHQSRVEYLKTKLSLLELQLRRSNLKSQQLQNSASSRRLQSAEQTQETVARQEQELKDKHPVVQKLASRNTELSQYIADTSRELKEVQTRANNANQRSLDLAEQFRSTQQKIEIAGLSQALGQVLLEEKRKLPNTNNLRTSGITKRDAIAEAGLHQIQHEDERRDLRNMEDYIEKLLEGIPGEIDESVKTELFDLAEQRRELLLQAIEIDQNYIRSLGELDFTLRQFIQKIESFNEFLTERLLWIRSSSPVNPEMLRATGTQLAELLTFNQIPDATENLIRAARINPLSGFIMLGLLVIGFKRSFFRRELERLSEPLKRLTTDEYRYTIRALILTIVYAATWPLIIYVIGRAIVHTPAMSPVTSSAAQAMISLSPIFFSFAFLRRFCLPSGLGILHFKWPKNSVTNLYRDLGRYQHYFIPTLFISYFCNDYSFDLKTGALPHLALVLTILMFSFCTFKLIKNPNGALRVYENRSFKVATPLLKRLLVLIAITLPGILSIVALSGYLYTAGTLSLHLLNSIVLLISLFLVHQLVVRWLVLTQRKIAYRNAIEKRNLARQKKAEEGHDTSEGSEILVEEPTVDLDALSKGSRELLNTVLVLIGAMGLWLIWSEILPAFGILEEISVWAYTESVAGKEQQVPVTLFDIGLAITVVVLTILAAKRVPALLEFILLQRIQLAAGSLYAMRTLSGYIIVAIGILAALSTIGASWSQIQWLAAALSVGIGFGLQEIVANFISGLIILFERPIRVGDVVTVGDTDGVVTKIKIRATTIRNWDQKELLVPNKEFITSRLLNWTLSDQTNRLLIPIGIAYGSDPRQAMELIEESARNNHNVLADPAPIVSFESFGDNALIIYLRAYISGLDVRLTTLTELHLDIYEKLNNAGIVIAFPQRDVHLDTQSPLEIRMVNPEGNKPDPAVD
ncbi:mechanosensitive ion channel domain-containing protein [Hahella ganghwensis]|uniref:mechanosensitive ion channel domain-containing protein n=1 Tax=Hahella ganghwensis TaxID=286420 RepID=UPI00036522B9|nr:mechanosensitive ion channel domain-containing protein [Hahella ganghwensis]